MLALGIAFALAASPNLVFLPSTLNANIQAAAVDASGNLYFTGAAGALTTTPGAFQTTFNLGKPCSTPTPGPCTDAFVAKFSPAGDLIYATYLGGSGVDAGQAIAVDGAGNVYVAGYTYSNDFPITANALNKTFTGTQFSECCQTPAGPGGEAFIAKLDPAGQTLVYSTFLGGNGNTVAQMLGIDAEGNAYVYGWTDAANFPVTPGAYGQKPLSSFQPQFVSKINPAGSALVYSTYFNTFFYDPPAPPGEVQTLALDAAGSVYLAGTVKSGDSFFATPGAFQTVLKGDSDAFVVKLSPDGSRVVYATFLGGSGTESGNSIAVDANGNAWLVGNTSSDDFPTTAPLPHQNGGVFVARLNSSGSSLVFSSRIGTVMASGADFGSDNGSLVLLDAAGNAFVNGVAQNPVTTTDAFERNQCGGGRFLAEWNPQGALLYSTLLKEGTVLGMDATENFYLQTYLSFASPASNLLAKFNPATRPLSASIACVGAADVAAGVSPGAIITLYGDRLGPQAPVITQFDANGALPTEVANTQVLFDGLPAPLLYVQASQINAIAPWELTFNPNSADALPVFGSLVVAYNGRGSIPLLAFISAFSPGIFCLNSASPCQGAILNEDGTVNSPSNPAKRGSTISIFGTGFGLLNPVPQDGTIVQDTQHLVPEVIEVVFFPGLLEAKVTYVGNVAMSVAGLIQVNAQIPESLPDSAVAKGVTFFIREAHNPVSNPVSIAVK